MYPLPYNITGLLSLATYVNVVTKFSFGWITMLFIAVVFFLSMNDVDNVRTALMIVSMVNFVVAVLFYSVGLIFWGVMLISCLLPLAIGLWVFIQKS